MVREKLFEVFPDLQKSILEKVEENLDVEALIYEKLLSFPVDKIEAIVMQVARKELRAIEYLGGLLGFLIGLLQFFLL